MGGEPPDLPDALKGEAPTVKLLYVWLLAQGEVDFSQRQIARALGLTQANVSIALNRLRDLDLVLDLNEARDRRRARLKAVPTREGLGK